MLAICGYFILHEKDLCTPASETGRPEAVESKGLSPNGDLQKGQMTLSVSHKPQRPIVSFQERLGIVFPPVRADRSFRMDGAEARTNGRRSSPEPTLPQKTREGWGNPVRNLDSERMGQPPMILVHRHTGPEGLLFSWIANAALKGRSSTAYLGRIFHGAGAGFPTFFSDLWNKTGTG